MRRPSPITSVAIALVLVTFGAGCTDDDPEATETNQPVVAADEPPVPSELVDAELGDPPPHYDMVQPFLRVDLSGMDCEDATALMVDHYVDNYDTSLQNERPLQPLAGYFTQDDDSTVASLAAEENSPLFLLSAYGITIGFEDRGRGTSPGDWCPVDVFETQFRDRLAQSPNPELANLDAGSTSASDAAAFAATILASMYTAWSGAS